MREALRADTQLVSLMHVNNETGVIQDVAAIGALCRERGVAFHVDAAQSAGKLPLDVEAMHVDLLSLTAHKIYGPKGIGALYVRRKPPLGLEPLLFGGGQERGLRSGTLPTHQIVGMGLAFELARARAREDVDAHRRAARTAVGGHLAASAACELNGHPEQRVRGHAERQLPRRRRREPAVRAARARRVRRLRVLVGAEEASYVLRALGSQRSARAELAALQSRPLHDRRARSTRAIAAVKREVARLARSRRQPASSAAEAVSDAPYSPQSSSSTSRSRATSGASRRRADVDRRRRAGDPEQGVRFELSARVATIASSTLRFEVYGCPHCIAAGSWLTERLAGATRTSCGAGAGARPPRRWSSRRRNVADCSFWRTRCGRCCDWQRRTATAHASIR